MESAAPVASAGAASSCRACTCGSHWREQVAAHLAAQPSRRIGGSAQSGPRQPPPHSHLPPEVHTPRFEQPRRQPCSHASPQKPSRHMHLGVESPPAASPAPTHSPRPLHPAWHVGRSHAAPLHPLLHWQPPSAHWPRPSPSPQSPTHRCLLQSTPPNPLKHAHSPVGRHAPWPSQSFGHSPTSQAGPDQPASHAHVPSCRQPPRPLQSAGQTGREQSTPRHPASQTQPPPPLTPLPLRPATHSPWPEQLCGHEAGCATAQAGPPHPAAQTHVRRRVSHHPWLGPAHS